MKSPSLAARLDRLRTPVRLAYLGVLLLATLSSLRLDLDAAAVGERFSRMLRPATSGRDLIDGARNLTLFAGWGLVWMLTSSPGRSWHALRNAVATGAGVSLFVEGCQLLSATRNASVLDVATNTGGSLAGGVLAVYVVVTLARWTKQRSFVGIPAALFAAAYGGAVAAEALVPLFRQDRIRLRGGLVERLAGSFAWFEWNSLWDLPLGDALLFFPAGVFGVAALHEAGRSYRGAALQVSVVATALFIATEVAHGVIGIEIQAGAILVHIGAVACGAWAAATTLPSFSRATRGVDRPRVLTGAYAVLLFLWALRPYFPEVALAPIVRKLSREWWIPLRLPALRVDVFSVVDVFTTFLLYVPLGALLAVWPLTHHGRLAAILPAIYLAAATESLQILVAGRTLDITDFLVQAAGAGIGWAVIRRAGFRPYGAQLGRGRRAPN